MTTSERLFLTLAKELHFGRAAEKEFISQQCLSDHIRRLEAAYNTPLFFRKPFVALTPAGEAVQRTLLLIKKLEDGLSNELEELENGIRGTLRIGMNYTRARILLPKFFAQYHLQYPHVHIEPVLEETKTMQELFTKGELDCFLGVNVHLQPPMEYLPLSQETIYLMASASFLQHYAGINPDSLENLKTEMELEHFNHLPFATNGAISTLNKIIEQHMISRQISIQSIFSVSDYTILSGICRSGCVASFCPQMFLPAILSENKRSQKDRFLYAFPIKGLQQVLDCGLVYNNMLHYPKFILDSFSVLRDAVRESLVIT